MLSSFGANIISLCASDCCDQSKLLINSLLNAGALLRLNTRGYSLSGKGWKHWAHANSNLLLSLYNQSHANSTKRHGTFPSSPLLSPADSFVSARPLVQTKLGHLHHHQQQQPRDNRPSVVIAVDVTLVSLASSRPPPTPRRQPSKRSPTHRFSVPLFSSSLDLVIVASSRGSDTIPVSIDSRYIFMAPHAEPSPPPSPGHEKPATDLHQASEALAHIRRYQLTQDVGDMLDKFTPGQVKSSVGYTVSLATSRIPDGLLARVDTLADSILQQIDTTFPSLPTVPLSRFTDPPKRVFNAIVVNPISSVRTATRIYHQSAKSYVAGSRDKFHENLTQIYTRNLEPSVAAVTDPYLYSINKRLSDSLDSEAPTESEPPTPGRGGAAREPEYRRTASLLRTAASRTRNRIVVPFEKQARHTAEDVQQGGAETEEAVRTFAGRIRDGIAYLREVFQEEASSEEDTGPVPAAKVGYKATSRVSGEVAGAGIVIAAKAVGVVWGVADLGRQRLGYQIED